MNQLIIFDLHSQTNFYSILNHGKGLLKHEVMLITQKMLNLRCLFHAEL